MEPLFGKFRALCPSSRRGRWCDSFSLTPTRTGTVKATEHSTRCWERRPTGTLGTVGAKHGGAAAAETVRGSWNTDTAPPSTPTSTYTPKSRKQGLRESCADPRSQQLK